RKGWEHIESAAEIARKVVERQTSEPLTGHFLLNVNIPAVPVQAIQEIRVTRLGKRHPSEPVVKTKTPYGDPVYWIGPVGSVSDSSADTDFGAIEQNAVSITPLRF